MPTILNWLLRLIPTNPICMRLVQGGSVRTRHLIIRSGYLAVMIVLLLFMMVSSSSNALSVRDMAAAGAQTFTWISRFQLALICLLTPIFMAGAIAQEANPRTWDILLTTPLNSLQIVLGNLFGRLFFVVALLFSTLPLFAITQFFGGVPGESIFASYAIAGISSLLVAAIAVTLSVTRTAGRRAVFIFYIAVVMYLFITAAADALMRQPVGPGSQASWTTLVTPLNPFLALEVMLSSKAYVPHTFDEIDATWIQRLWFGSPIAAYAWLGMVISFFLIAFSTMRLRVIGAKVGTIPWYRRMFGLGAKGATERPARRVSNHPVAWREAVARGKSLPAIAARWGFVAVGVLVAIILVTTYHTKLISSHQDFRIAVQAIVGAELVIIILTSLQLSATAVSREREDGSLDIILTTPIQPGPYLAGKLRGLVVYLVPMMIVPVVTLAIIAIYTLADGFGRTVSFPVDASRPGGPMMPLILPEAAIAVPLMFVPFVAFCVVIGLSWSIKSKGTIGSVIAAVVVVLTIAGILGLCGLGARSLPIVGAVLNTFSPMNLLWAVTAPDEALPDSFENGSRAGLVVGAAITGAIYIALVIGLHTNMKRTFMMTVRKLAGTS
ncbi:MAG: ABC transporter permease subunit [Phycisphaerales bacterium]|nr:ABC transporter permease subunit [Phycisphaerales bacterium]